MNIFFWRRSKNRRTAEKTSENQLSTSTLAEKPTLTGEETDPASFLEAQRGSDSVEAWLELASGEVMDLRSPFMVGRRASSNYVIDAKEVSREHCMLVRDADGKWRISDLGSVNGTFVNGRKIVEMILLQDGDRVKIGDEVLVFRQRVKLSDFFEMPPESATIAALKTKRCWILVMDIIGSTPMSRELGYTVYHERLNHWATVCRRHIESHNGVVNKFIGDAILAYWVDEDGIKEQVLHCIKQLRSIRSDFDFEYRVLVHYGLIHFGGVMKIGEESIWGPSLNFIFKCERLASQNRVLDLFTGAVQEEMEALRLVSLGQFEVPGFKGRFKFYTLSDRA